MIWRPFVRPGGLSGGGGASTISVDDASLLYAFDEGSGTSVLNQGSIASGDMTAGAISWTAEGGEISSSAGTGSISSTPVTRITMFAAFRWEEADAGYSALFANPANELLLATQEFPGNPRFRFGDTNCTASWCRVHDGQWHILEGAYDGAKLYLVLDGVPLMEVAATGKSATLTNLVLGAANNGSNIFPGVHGYQAIFTRYLSDAQRQVVRNNIRAIMIARGATFPTPIPVGGEGDSIFASMNGQLMTANLTDYPWSRNFAMGGTGLVGGLSPTLFARATTTDSLIRYTGRGILTVLVGRNDFLTLTAAQFITKLQEYVADRRRAGFYVLVSELLPSTATNFNSTFWTPINSAIRANTGSWHDGPILVTDNALIGQAASAADPTYYSDGTHPTAAGSTVYVDECWKPAVDAFYASIAA